MLGKANKEEAAKVKTLRLARGTPTSPGRPSRPLRTPSGQSVSGSSVKLRSPAEETKSASLSLLQQISILELLDQDDRPTFVIDLGNHANLEPGPLNIVFSNVALKASMGLLEMVTGKTDLNSPGLSATTAFNEFKAWITSYVKNNQSLDVTLPSFSYAGATWICSTLRKRLRVIRGVPNTGSAGFGGNSPSFAMSASSSMEKESVDLVESQTNHVEAAAEEAQDYFSHVLRPKSRSDRLPIEKARSALPLGPDNNHSVGHGKDRALPIREGSGSSQVDHFDIQSQSDQRFFDWTRLPNSPALPPHIQFARSIDWASTALGPIEAWSSDLRSMCNLIMASPHPAAMYWGEDLVAIYNEAYILLAGEKHPQLMGQSYRVAWQEIWDQVKDVFATAMSTGQATMKDDDCLFIQRSSLPGCLEETYFSWSIIPLVGSDGSVAGLYNPAFEKTRRKIAERRMLTLREVGEKTSSAPELRAFWGQVLKALESNQPDTPFVLMYSVSDDVDSDASSIQSNTVPGTKYCSLEGKLGVPDGHNIAPQNFDLKNGTEFFASIFREAMSSGKPTLIRVEDGTLDPVVFDGLDWRGFGDACHAAVICPIQLTSGESILGFLVMGINPRRPYDDDYSLYVQLLSRQLATSMASVVLFEEEIARGRRAARLAALDRIELSEQLAARTQEAVESETRFSRMAELVPVGIFIADKAGQITYCNDTWYEISKAPKGAHAYDEWMESVKNEDKEMVKTLWSELVNGKTSFSSEFRFKASWQDPQGNKADTWVLASAYPEKNEDGTLKVIFGSITDISRQKWAEHFEKRRVEEAVELKRQQENFIDITSHEMRNPLSAILQCADEISTTLTSFQSDHDTLQSSLDSLLDNAVDSAHTIALCAQHQKRIVDDVLTLSKLDSALLLVTPDDVLPVSVAQRALKMFDGEVQTADIQLDFTVDESMEKLSVKWVKLDPSRLLQVLINLITNAIKFTSSREKRVITVKLGATLERPRKEGLKFVSYFPTRAKHKDLTKGSDWGTGEKIYIHFAVEDTGRGLTEDEKKLLFLRFSQASPRTHVQYGGSGLGLFISRELVELQGGEIGVSSKAGEGSIFAFYVKARRSTAPAEVLEQLPTKTASSKAASTTVASNGRKILIVEDNLVNQKVLKKQLENLGYPVLIANHGEECLDQLRKSSFWSNHGPNALDLTVILMDLEMPVMDGLTCARKIRDLEQSREIIHHVPIIAVTANARAEQIETATDAGMDDVVSKPFRIPELIPKIEQLSEKFHTAPVSRASSPTP